MSEIAGIDIAEFSRRFRAAEPVLLVYPFQKLPWTGLIKCAPLGQALCAVNGWSDHLDRALSQWSTVPGVCTKDTYKLFRQELESGGVARELAPSNLINGISWSGVASGTWLRDFGRRCPFLGKYRLVGHYVPNESLEFMIAHYQEELECYGEHAFIHAEEESDLFEIEEGSTACDARRIFRHVSRMDLPDEALRQKILNELGNRMLEGVDALTSGRPWDPQLAYVDRIEIDPWFLLGDATNFGPGNSMEAEIYSLRARLMLLLEWPHAYRSVSAALERFRWQIKQYPIQFAMPYDIESDLEAYLGKIEGKYPIVKKPIDLISTIK